MLNNVTLVGTLAADPTSKREEQCSFDLNVEDFFWSVKEEKMTKKVHTFKVVQLGKGCEKTLEYKKEGHEVGLTGELKTTGDGQVYIETRKKLEWLRLPKREDGAYNGGGESKPKDDFADEPF